MILSSECLDDELRNHGTISEPSSHLSPIVDINKRQDSLDLGNLTFPMLVTAFLAAFFASLIGSTLAGNLSNMLSMEFKVPQGIQVKALPAVRIGITPSPL